VLLAGDRLPDSRLSACRLSTDGPPDQWQNSTLRQLPPQWLQLKNPNKIHSLMDIQIEINSCSFSGAAIRLTPALRRFLPSRGDAKSRFCD
jgi:hypothetical protein